MEMKCWAAAAAAASDGPPRWCLGETSKEILSVAAYFLDRVWYRVIRNVWLLCLVTLSKDGALLSTVEFYLKDFDVSFWMKKSFQVSLIMSIRAKCFRFGCLTFMKKKNQNFWSPWNCLRCHSKQICVLYKSIRVHSKFNILIIKIETA